MLLIYLAGLQYSVFSVHLRILCQSSPFVLVTKAGSSFCNLPLKSPTIRWRRNTKNSTEGFSQWTAGFCFHIWLALAQILFVTRVHYSSLQGSDVRLILLFAPMESCELLLPSSAGGKTSDLSTYDQRLKRRLIQSPSKFFLSFFFWKGFLFAKALCGLFTRKIHRNKCVY